MSAPYFFADHMTVGYGRTPLIRDICLHIRRGQIVTLIGPNGAGKSTILKSIIFQLKLLGGSVYLDGISVKDMTERQLALRMSVVMTDRARTEFMTCREVVAMGGINWSDERRDGDLGDSLNLSFRRWPSLTTRKGRTQKAGYEGITALCAHGKLAAVRGRAFFSPSLMGTALFRPSRW